MRSIFVATVLGAIACGSAVAQQSLPSSLGVYVYPSGGQAPEQQAKDEQECYGWAQQNAAPPPAAPPSQPAPAADPGGAAAAGAITTAARYALLADVTGNENDMGEAAAVGAIRGARRGAASAQQRNAQAQQQAAQQQQQAAAQQQQQLKNAFSACIEGRGYTVR
jgi:hypothetical protein